MNTESSLNWPDAEMSSPMRRRRWPLVVFLVLALFLGCAASAFAWLNQGLLFQFAGRLIADTDAAPTDKSILTDLLAAQQKTSEDLAAIDKAITNQQEQLTAIVSQLASLSSKIETMTSSAQQSPAVAPGPSPTPAIAVPTAAVAPAAILRVAPKQKRLLPRAPNPTGPISIGGAPLSTAPDAPPR